MTIDEYRAVQQRIGWSWSELGRFFGLDLTTLWRYRTGRMTIPGDHATAMRALADGWRPRD